MKTALNLSIAIATLALLLTSCMKENLGGGSDHKATGSIFDFSTTKTYTLNLKYDVPEGYVVGFDVYSENPFEINADEQKVLKTGITPIEKGFTDAKGAYSNPITLPSYLKTIYIYTDYVGINPRLLVASVENGQLTNAIPETTSTKSMLSKAGGTINYNTLLTSSFLYSNLPYKTLTLGKWHYPKDGSNATTLADGTTVKIFGRPSDMSYVNKAKFGADANTKDALVISADVLKTINTALKGDESNTPVDKKYLQSGDIHVTKEAELDLIFIQNWGDLRNTLTYYCYPTANPPKSTTDIKYQTIAIANAMEIKRHVSLSDTYDAVSLFKGEGIKLKYVDDRGVMHDKFPAGTSVGWVLYRNGYSGFSIDPSLGQPITKTPSVGKGANFSNPALSPSPNTAILRHGDFIVIGFDDGDPNDKNAYRDYLDVMFNVQSTPSNAITDNVPDVEPEDPKPVKVQNMGILLYEDLWPFQGDFDMNDVVVKYMSTMTKNKDNEITATDIDFTIMHSGATFDNSFAYYDPNVSSAKINITGGNGASAAVIDAGNNTVRLANNILGYANNTKKTTFKVNYEYNSPITASKYMAPPFNPFITIGNKRVNGEMDSNNGTGKEVHLTNYPPTAAADMSWFEKKAHDWSNPTLGLYYITYENHSAKVETQRGQQLPYAVNIVFDNEQNMNTFNITQEGKHINKHYTGFKNWVNSNGKDNADWYLHFTK